VKKPTRAPGIARAAQTASAASDAWKKSPAGLSALGFAKIGPVAGGAAALAAARKGKSN